MEKNKMIGKLVELHTEDSFYDLSKELLGTLWEIDSLQVWDSDSSYPQIGGYSYGDAKYIGEEPINVELEDDGTIFFFAAKFEIIENDEVK